LNDEGRGGDRAAHDHLFTGLAPNPRAGRYAIRIEVEDHIGNSAAHALPQTLEFTLPPPAPSAVR
jgi:hypothetical protein